MLKCIFKMLKGISCIIAIIYIIIGIWAWKNIVPSFMEGFNDGAKRCEAEKEQNRNNLQTSINEKTTFTDIDGYVYNISKLSDNQYELIVSVPNLNVDIEDKEKCVGSISIVSFNGDAVFNNYTDLVTGQFAFDLGMNCYPQEGQFETKSYIYNYYDDGDVRFAYVYPNKENRYIINVDDDVRGIGLSINYDSDYHVRVKYDASTTYILL